MNRDIISAPAFARGRVRPFRVTPSQAQFLAPGVFSGGVDTILSLTGTSVEPFRLPMLSLPGQWEAAGPWSKNDVLYDWASIISRLMSTGESGYRIAGMYFEFKNVADPDDPVTPPAFGRSGGIAYYNALSGSPDIDYLRVPLVAATRTSTDAELFPDGNLVTFFAMSQGTTGVHGKPFAAANNSKVYGGALVSIPDQGDRTKDLVFSRFYFSDPDEQQVKLSTSQLGLEWEIELQ